MGTANPKHAMSAIGSLADWQVFAHTKRKRTLLASQEPASHKPHYQSEAVRRHQGTLAAFNRDIVKLGEHAADLVRLD